MKVCCKCLGLILLAWLIGLSPAPAQASPRIILQDTQPRPLAQDFLVMRDESGQLAITDIIQLEQAQRFEVAQDKTLNDGYSEAHYWLKLDIENRTQEEDWFIVGQSPFLRLKAFRMESQGAAVMAPDPAHIKFTSISRLRLKRGERATFFLRVETPHLADLRFELLNRYQLVERHNNERTLKALIAGCFLAMIFYNLVLFITLRDRNYFHYLVFALVNSHLNLMSVAFPSNIMSWLGWDWWEFLDFYQPLAPLTAFLFARSFLQTALMFPKLDKALLLYGLGLVLFMLASFFLPRNLNLSLQDPYFFLGIFLLFFTGFYSLAQGFRPAAYFLAGVGSFLLGMLIYLLMATNLAPSTFVTSHAHLIGQATEMILMSLALGARIKLMDTAKTRAEVTAEVKSRLLRITSHDLATPLTVIKATAQHLKKSGHDQPRVDRIVRATEIMEDIIGFVRKSESMPQGVELPREPVPVKAIFEEIAFLFQDRAQEKDVQLNFKLDQPDLVVFAERVSLINEVLGNLLSNSLKFSFPRSTIDISACAPHREFVEIVIRDYGMGMDESMLKNVFDFSKKNSRPGTQGERGIGFGMPLVKAYIDAYGGFIEVESIAVNKDPERAGTRVCITLPAAP